MCIYIDIIQIHHRRDFDDIGPPPAILVRSPPVSFHSGQVSVLSSATPVTSPPRLFPVRLRLCLHSVHISASTPSSS
ncbi:hypothetical protein Bca4012_010277 [Brassica carinata]